MPTVKARSEKSRARRGVRWRKSPGPSHFSWVCPCSWSWWWPFAWSDYWILDLAPDYSYALVGVPARDSMWILSRRPDMEPAVYERLVAKARALGFDVGKLIRTRQTGQ